MKTLLCLLVLSVAIVHSAVLVDKNTPRNNLDIGAINPGDRLLARSYLSRTPLANIVQLADFSFHGNSSTSISAILATEQEYTQPANLRIFAGGLDQTFVILRAQSQIGNGFNYLIEVFGQ